MKGSSNVVRRGGWLHFRRRVPQHLTGRLGRHEITGSLKTCDHRLGRLRSKYLYIRTEALFAALESKMLSDDDVAKIVSEFYAAVAQIDNLTRLASPPLTVDEQAAQLLGLADHRDLLKSELGRGEYSFAALGASIAIAKLGREVSALERRQIEQALMRAGLDATKNVEARLSGDFGYSPADALLQPRRTVAAEGRISVTSTLPTSKPPSRKSATISQASEVFLAHQTKDRIWDAQTLSQARKTYSLLVDVCGDGDLMQIGRKEARAFKETLQDLPADYGKAALFRGLRTSEILSIDKQREGAFERLSTRTVKRHFSAASALWRWAIIEDIASENPFLGFAFPSVLRANEQRDMWLDEELERLFETPVWTGSHSAGRRSMAGDLIIKDERYWLPLIAVYSGLRQEEIAQLHLDDIRRVEEFWIFDINAKPPRKLKNRNAVRKVPVHTQLIALGLMKLVSERKEAGQTFLFDFTPGGADQRFGHAFSKWFTRYRRDVGQYRKGLDFHSFRHTATTLMQRAGVPISAIDELTGHATPGETARYSHGLSMEQLVAGIEAIDFRVRWAPKA